MIMAGVGLVILGIRLAKRNVPHIDKDVFFISIMALLVSLSSFSTMAYNGTNDGSFLTFFMSEWVWLGGAYCLINWLNVVYGHLSVKLVCQCLIAVCVCQCILALTMDMYSPLKQFVDGFLGGEEAFMGNAGNRMYGIGAALDVAGFRFSACMVMIAVLSCKCEAKGVQYLYWLAFFVILVIGSMIGRSTIVGASIAFTYVIFYTLLHRNALSKSKLLNMWQAIFVIGLLGTMLGIYEYGTNAVLREHFRFGFEGFFSLVERGYWQTNSTDIMVNNMIVFPETLRTWIIGDGYCANPLDDPYYIGPLYHGFYMATDIGYLRFLFYFGVIGLVFLVGFIILVSVSCMKRFPSYKVLFLLLLIVNLIEWFKVSTDIFLVFAPFLCLSSDEEFGYNERARCLSVSN